MKREIEERCCGDCCWFCFEQTDGEGQCPARDGGWLFTNCGSNACKDYVSNARMRHYMAVLLQANRYRRDQNVPAIYKMPNPTELGKAIDAAVRYYNVMSKI